ncbi:hypothetical protein BDQ17DRAFT_1547000 [Cyathus striatus]|nr:hypothetical protein BDQ17DRAFT_1547000 [Cyathus striatus]
MATGIADYAHSAATSSTISLATVLNTIYTAIMSTDSLVKAFPHFFSVREIWGKYVPHMKDLYAPGNERKASTFKNQSVFNFCVIPQTMAIATSELCFMNGEMFKRNIKIRKAEVASLIMRSTNPREVGLIFRDYARRIHAKADPTDPSFLKISVACGKICISPLPQTTTNTPPQIEQWLEHNYPSFVRLATDGQSGGFDQLDARTYILNDEQKRENELIMKKRLEEIRGGIRNGSVAATGNGVLEQGKDMGQYEVMMYVMGGFTLMVVLSLVVVFGVLKLSGDA